MREEPVRLLSRGGLETFEVDLNDGAVLGGGKDLNTVRGYGLRMLRHGSNPGARFEVRFSGARSTQLFAPGQCVRGGFDGVTLKRAKGGAKIGRALFAVLSEPLVDLTEDLIISALGPVDLLGTTDEEGAIATSIAVPEDTDPNAAFATQVGAFDGSGWELLRVMVSGAALESADVHWFFNPSYVGTNWQHASSVEGPSVVSDSPTTAYPRRVFMLPWGGRGIGCPAVYSLLPAGLTALNFNIQGVR